jgi:SHS2 domain-containing protein
LHVLPLSALCAQIHSWGASFAEAFEHAAIGMFAYMTPLERVDCWAAGSARTERFECDGHDLDSLLFNFLDALLFTFSTDLFVCREIHIEEFDAARFRIRARGFVFAKKHCRAVDCLSYLTFPNCFSRILARRQVWRGV